MAMYLRDRDVYDVKWIKAWWHWSTGGEGSTLWRPIIGLGAPALLVLFIIIAAAPSEEEPTGQVSLPATATQVAPTSTPVPEEPIGQVEDVPALTTPSAIVPTQTPIPPPARTSVPRVPTATLEPTPEASSRPSATPRPSATLAPSVIQTTWRGLTIAPESRCSPYDSNAYRYSPSVEDRIVAEYGGVYGPYTGRWFVSQRETDIEHIVARSEAHDSGLCADPQKWAEFASDLLNLTLASPEVNRNLKGAKDAAEWLPDQNQCWFAGRVIVVRLEYDLTIDQREADALDRVLAGCTSTALVVLPRDTSPSNQVAPTPADSEVDALQRWDDNGDGRITCAEARRHGIAPVPRGHPAYPYMDDRDGDGIVCE